MPPPVQPGQVIKGKYQVDRVLGEGGMGVVVAGHHVGLGQRVAIKFLQTSMLQHAEIVERFAREARAASKLESDHVARVTDVDTMEDGTPYMVMEYLEGQDLSTVRASGRPLPLAAAVGYVLEACEAFGEAHSVGIVHRDIKPANLFLAKRGQGKTRVKVLDFGISKMGADGDAAVTRTSTVMGSAHYMSPEQMLTPREVDHRTDIWALGVTLFELTTARLPFPGESVTQVCAMIMATQPPLPSSMNSALPTGFDAVVMKCLGRNPKDRYASVAELAAALAPFAASSSPSFGRAPAMSVPAITTPPILDTSPRTTALPDSSPRHSVPAMPPGAYQHQPTQVGLGASASGAYGAPAYGNPMASAAAGSNPFGSGPHVAPMPGMNTSAPVSRTDATPKTPSKVPMILGAIALGGLFIGGSAFALFYKASATGGTATTGGAPAITTTMMATPSSTTLVSPPATPPDSPVVTPSESAPPAPVAPAPPSAAAPPPSAKKPEPLKGPSAPRPAPETPAPPKKPAANCNPPFTVDAQGVKRAKPECL